MEERKSNVILSIAKGTGTAIIVTLIGVLIFAGVVRLAALGTGVIKAVNQFIKVLSVFLGCFFSVRGKFGFLQGGAIGILSSTLTYLLFALIGGEMSFGLPFIIDLVFAVVVGAVAGIIAVNLKNKN